MAWMENKHDVEMPVESLCRKLLLNATHAHTYRDNWAPLLVRSLSALRFIAVINYPLTAARLFMPAYIVNLSAGSRQSAQWTLCAVCLGTHNAIRIAAQLWIKCVLMRSVPVPVCVQASERCCYIKRAHVANLPQRYFRVTAGIVRECHTHTHI